MRRANARVASSEKPEERLRAEEADPEREDWLRLAGECFEAAYGDDEPEYPLSLIKVPNPDYERG